MIQFDDHFFFRRVAKKHQLAGYRVEYTTQICGKLFHTPCKNKDPYQTTRMQWKVIGVLNAAQSLLILVKGIGDYTTELDNKPLQGSLLNNQYTGKYPAWFFFVSRVEGEAGIFSPLFFSPFVGGRN